MGGALFAPSLAGLMQGCTPRGASDWTPEKFSDLQANAVETLADVLIPETDTPGARQVGVPEWMERMVFNVYNQENRGRFLEGLDDLILWVEEEFGSPLHELARETAHEAVQLLNDGMVQRTLDRPATGSYRIVKELTLLGYYSSEPGATEELRYEAVPGRYEGCIPYEEVGATWAT